MKRILLLFLTIFFPWFVLLISDDPIGAVIAMVMQATVIGWIPASLWAWRSIPPPWKAKKPKKIKET